MIMSVDGAHAIDGRSGAMGSDADHEMFHALRGACDAVLVAAGTARAEGYRRPTTTDADLVALRAVLDEFAEAVEQGRDAVGPAMYESRDILWICTELSKRLGFPESFNFTIDQYRKWQLEGIPEAYEVIKQDGVYYNPSKVYGIYFDSPLKTQAKKIELFNQRYAHEGLDPMPVYKTPRRKDGAFRLVVGRTAFFTHSNTNNALLIEFKDENTLWMHPGPAQRLGLRDGERVEVGSAAGKVELALRLFEGMEEGTVYMATGFGSLSPGQPLVHNRGASIAEVLEDHADFISGNMAMHETLVTVSRRGA